MASGKEIRDRVFALSGAILFFVTASALTIAVIVTNVQEGKQKKQAAAITAAQAAQQNCTDTQTEVALAAPEVFKPEGKVTELQTTDLTPGDGAAVAAGDCAVVKYYGTLASDGSMFDENYTKTTGFAFPVGGGQVIKGWDQGLIGMKVGGERRLVIPADLAYADQAQGDKIPANSDLVFVVKLLRIQK